MKQKGFTLIELLVVVAIIGILTTVGVSVYSKYTTTAKKSGETVNYLKTELPGIRADDISKLEIEGISIGDSLLEFATKKNVTSNYVDYYVNKKYAVTELFPEEFKKKINNYEKMQFQFKLNDKKMLIQAMSGIISYQQNMKYCYQKLDKVYEEVISSFGSWKDLGKETYEQKDVGAKITDYILESESGDEIQIACYDYHDDYKYHDHFRIALRTYEYKIWLYEEAYKK